MKVVIAAAGQGTRMLDLSMNKSKHLIEVEKRPFLAYVLDNLVAAGYNDIILVVGFKEELMEEFRKEFLKYVKSSGELKIRIINQHKILGPKEKEYGTACPVKCVKNEIGKENFIYLYGDNLFSVNDLRSLNIEDNFCYIAGLKHQNSEKYGVLIRDGEDFLDKIIEKPKEFVGNLINTGLYKFSPEIFNAISQIKKSSRGEYELTDAITLLAKKDKVKVLKLKDYWLDLGKIPDIRKIGKFLDKHN